MRVLLLVSVLAAASCAKPAHIKKKVTIDKYVNDMCWTDCLNKRLNKKKETEEKSEQKRIAKERKEIDSYRAVPTTEPKPIELYKLPKIDWEEDGRPVNK